MNVNFWGVRGSLGAPLLPEQVQAKINAVVQLIQPKDLESLDTRQKFLSAIPPSIYGTVGGNTLCVQVVSETGEELIFDAGTGIRVMGTTAPLSANSHYSVLFSHLHWDHIQGFPFFGPLYNPNVTFDIYSPIDNTPEFFAAQMKAPYYPVDFDVVKNRINFNQIAVGQEFQIANLKVMCCKMSHPGGSYSYAVTENSKKVVYATDIELYDGDFKCGDDVNNVFQNADVCIIDSQYTPQEAYDKTKWGHSAFCYAVDFAAEMKIKKLYLFHHEPSHDDKKLNSILQSARWYADFISERGVQIELAVEGQSFSL